MSLPQTVAKENEALPEWRLTDLFPGHKSPEFHRAKTEAETETHAFRDTLKGKVGTLSPKDLASAVERYDALQDRLGKISSYVGLAFAADASDAEIGKLYGDNGDWLTKIGSDLLFFELELNRIPDDKLKQALGEPRLGRYKPWFDQLLAFKPYQLDDELERAFLERAQTANGAWIRLYDETLTALRYDVRGKQLTGEEALHLLSEPERDLRRDAAAALTKTFKENLRLFAHITNTLAKDKEIEDGWRKYPDATTSRHLGNRVEPEVVEALASSVRAAYPKLSHAYYTLKAKLLKLDRLEYWDRNAPMPFADDKKIDWPHAKALVLDAYGTFNPRLAEIAEGFFAKSWIDAKPRPGKTGGAFSHPTVPSAHPFIMMSYQGKTRDVMTLAHELGHGVHQVLAAHHGPILSNTPLTLAETASVFGEMLTFRALLKAEHEPRARAAMLAAKVEDMLNTVVRQIAFYTFERRVHAARREGELTADDLGRIWLEVQTESLGPAFHFADGYEAYWCYISHFIHSPFYVYAYAFGDCLVNSLYAVYEKSPAGFAERYLDLLAAGGTKHYREALAPFGLDPSDGAFWNKGLEMISGLIRELETEIAGLK
ncbi:MAG: M3 family oligoendopeptidase [Alphaproteobacteria bacterium]|nr:M3 family oligoendopeptidase [Alphaproteobacteria bacterium]